ncbi:hypothetical protein BLAT2472_130040 [Burkholderia latens]
MGLGRLVVRCTRERSECMKWSDPMIIYRTVQTVWAGLL